MLKIQYNKKLKNIINKRNKTVKRVIHINLSENT
jgi:hypothetical protein